MIGLLQREVPRLLTHPGLSLTVVVAIAMLFTPFQYFVTSHWCGASDQMMKELGHELDELARPCPKPQAELELHQPDPRPQWNPDRMARLNMPRLARELYEMADEIKKLPDGNSSRHDLIEDYREMKRMYEQLERQHEKLQTARGKATLMQLLKVKAFRTKS